MLLEIFNTHPYFIIIAIVCSFWVTYHVPSIHTVKSWQDFVFPQLIHQFLLNLSGSLLGWISLYYFLWERPSGTLTLVDLVVLLIAYVGITGYLPHLVINKGFRP